MSIPVRSARAVPIDTCRIHRTLFAEGTKCPECQQHTDFVEKCERAVAARRRGENPTIEPNPEWQDAEEGGLIGLMAVAAVFAAAVGVVVFAIWWLK